jgi:hypothetical protein
MQRVRPSEEVVMTGEVLVLFRRAALSALVLLGAAFATFELTAAAEPAPMHVTPTDDGSGAAAPPSAHALAPTSSSSSWPQVSRL